MKISENFIHSHASEELIESDSTHSVLIDVIRTTVQISGLSALEANIVLHTWARCDARLAIDSEATQDFETLNRPTSLSWTQFHENLVSWATLKAIESGRGELFMFHAAALSCPDTGATIILTAESGTGKTTATLNLAKALGYVTDETAAFGLDGRLHPYAKPLSLLPASKQRPKTQYSPEDLNLIHPNVEPYVAAIAILDRDRSGERITPTLETLPIAEALSQVIPQISSLAHLDRGLVQLCQQIDSLGGVIRLHYSEASDLTTVVNDLLASQWLHQVGEWTALEVGMSNTAAPTAGYYRRVQVDDAILLSNEIAILINEEYFVLSGIGPAIWQSLSSWKSSAELLDEIVAEHGRPSDAELMLNNQLAVLTDQGIVERS
ncbi:hypothetical protein [Paeniglutamicibacter sp. Y32M11]|uniref:hypothetical protein n=1 Tax=Paeniglutamicibacter sp. Y32M11 TaxID=2853258 RepID=UPI001C5317D5|nr:hypothetical protein [Paeniglutamicibacter sp. Y32M11]QXQ09654.1 hypothetical protein KUF55_14475 [Paeniglutamicibacter sp. Y32M11]